MTALVWGLEWRIALARRRLFVLNTVVPLLLVVPVATGAAPAVHAAAIYAVLFVIFSTFGSAIPLVRDAENGMTARMLLGGVSPSGYLLQRAAAGAALDGLQLIPALVVAGFGAGASPRALLVTFGTLLGTAWVGNLIGPLVAVTTRSLAEAALFTAVCTLLLLHMSGVFRTPAPSSHGALVEAASPFRALHEALLGMGSAGPVGGGGALAAWAVLLAAGTAVFAGPVTRALRRVSRG
ncbi:MAG TPA: ABC transporter permease [Longimicrobiales bacterium]|nr:ABC transporter permease [Longimicrobiales bacterium]